MPVLIHLGAGEDGLKEAGRKASRRPPWSYCSVQLKEKEAVTEKKDCRGPVEEVVVFGGEPIGAFASNGRTVSDSYSGGRSTVLDNVRRLGHTVKDVGMRRFAPDVGAGCGAESECGGHGW